MPAKKCVKKQQKNATIRKRKSITKNKIIKSKTSISIWKIGQILEIWKIWRKS
jgi:hypothetical protein